MAGTLIAILLCVTGVYSTIEFVPSGHLNWTPENVKNLTCPSFLADESVRQYGKSIGVKTAPRSKDIPHDGYICVTSQWSVTCDFRWYGSKYISNDVIRVPTTESMCRESIQKVMKGIPVVPFMPTENCGWNNVLVEEKQFTTATKHTVKKDPFGMMYIDSEFSDGKCGKEVCDAPNHMGIWIANKDNNDACSDLEVSAIDAYPSTRTRDWDADSFILTLSQKPLRIADSCKLRLCGLNGYRFKNGEWYSLTTQIDSGMQKQLDKVPNCPSDIQVHVHDSHSEAARIESLGMELALQVLCIQELRRSQDTGKVSNFLLSFLAPIHSGYGRVHRINKGKLETALGFYNKVTLARKPKLSKIGSSGSKNIAYEDTVVMKEGSKTMSLFNGNTYEDGEIKWIKNSIRTNVITDLDKEDFIASYIDHPHADHLPSKFNYTMIHKTGYGESENVFSSIQHWAGGLWQSITSTLLMLVAIAFFIILFLWIIRTCCLTRHKTPTIVMRDHDTVPLTSGRDVNLFSGMSV
ncbi:glycoprotein [Harbour porpoise rhabdovirus]|uniref:Glycoprotein n=1 Tax=Harbour porpoise rhabdovirus TaxID=2598784 RepID=A0AAE6M2V7_9RHAB|nr:glycoprotein [Harbour porpoise rhabdovirus]QDZ59980.1 glycoprotein [Harbour porpoise rhabdovirus]